MHTLSMHTPEYPTESRYENMIYQARGILNSDTATFHLKSLPNPSYFALQNCHKQTWKKITASTFVLTQFFILAKKGTMHNVALFPLSLKCRGSS